MRIVFSTGIFTELIHTEDLQKIRHVANNSNYQAKNPPTVHVGLAQVDKADLLTIG